MNPGQKADRTDTWITFQLYYTTLKTVKVSLPHATKIIAPDRKAQHHHSAPCKFAHFALPLPKSAPTEPLPLLEQNMRLTSIVRLAFSLCLLSTVLTGCFFHTPSRHLASDICLITPNLTAQEVISYLGPPDEKQNSEQGEIWLYYEVKKSTLRSTPFIGAKMGSEQYDVVTINFVGEKVHTCIYRFFNEKEMKESGIKISEPRAD